MEKRKKKKRETCEKKKKRIDRKTLECSMILTILVLLALL